MLGIKGQDEITNSADIIDSRDVIARIRYLEEKETALEDAEEELADEGDGEDLDKTLQEAVDNANADFDEDERKELKDLRDLQEQAEGYSDWLHGATLIRDSFFGANYARRESEDLGDEIDDLPVYIRDNIDWEGVAKYLKQDYTVVTFGGEDYLIK